MNNTAPVFSVQLSITASGSVEDYTEALKDSILDAFAVAAGLADADGKSPLGSTLSVTAASVLLVATFPVPSAAIADAAVAKIQTDLTSPADVNALFSAQGVSGVTCESAPIAQKVSGGGGGCSAAGLSGGAAAGGPLASLALPGLGAIAILLFELLYILVKYRGRLLALCVRGDGGDAGGADAAAAAAAAGEDDGGDGGDEDGGKGKGEGGDEEDPVADYLDHNYTKGLDDSETVAVSPVMLYKVNRAKKRAREAARQAALEGGGDGDGGGGGGACEGCARCHPRRCS